MLARVAPKQLVRRAFATTRLTALEEFPHTEVAPAAARNPTWKESTLSNGIKLFTKDQNSMLVGLNFSFVGGSRTETDDQQGSAEYLSVGAFAGNKHSSGLRTVRSLEALGAVVDVNAGREHLTYSLQVLPDKVKDTVKEVFTAVSHPPHDNYILTEMLDHVQLRYKAFEANPEMQLMEALHDAAFGEASPLGSSRFAVNAQSINPEEILAYRNANFNAGRLVVTASGIAHDELANMLTDASKDLSAADQNSGNTPASPFVGGEHHVRKDYDGYTFAAVAFPVPAGADANSYAVLQHYLDSTLKQNKSRGSAFFHSYSTGGMWGISARGYGADAINDQLQAAVAALKSVADGSASAAVANAKTAVSVARLADMESSHRSAARTMLRAFRQGVSVDTYCKLKDVSAASVQAAAKASLGAANIAYAAVGKTKAAPSWSAIQKMIKA